MRTNARQARERAIAKRIGHVIRAERDAKGLTLEQLGALAEIDVSQLSKVERGVGGTKNATYERIANELGLTLADLFRHAALDNKRAPKGSKKRGSDVLDHGGSLAPGDPRT